MNHIADEMYNLPMLSRELAKFMLGKKLGEGSSREVYEFKHDSEYVMKIETGEKNFQNSLEWQIWNEVLGTPLEKWFAPCLDISNNGIYLIQRKVAFPSNDQYPKKIPSIFTDTKYGNFGMLDGKFVCCDYGTTVITHGKHPLTRAEWWIGRTE